MKKKGWYFVWKSVTSKIDMYKVKSFMLIHCGLGQKLLLISWGKKKVDCASIYCTLWKGEQLNFSSFNVF